MSESPSRPPAARQLDRWLTRALNLLGRAWGRPDDGLLTELTGRQRGGGPEPGLGRAAAALAEGRRALTERRFAEALHLFATAAELDPADPWAWHGRGDAFQLSGDHASALQAYQEALERAPGLALAWNGVGNAQEGLGRPEAAEAAWRRSLELDPSLSWPSEGLARLEADRRDR